MGKMKGLILEGWASQFRELVGVGLVEDSGVEIQCQGTQDIIPSITELERW